MDRDDIADNQVKKWKEDPGDPIEVSVNLVALVTELYQMAIVEDDEDGEDGGEQVLDVDAALKSQEYKKYINACSELQMLQILDLQPHQKVAFFLNVYQCMYVHNFLKKVFEEGDKEEEGQS